MYHSSKIDFGDRSRELSRANNSSRGWFTSGYNVLSRPFFLSPSLLFFRFSFSLSFPLVACATRVRALHPRKINASAVRRIHLHLTARPGYHWRFCRQEFARRVDLFIFLSLRRGEVRERWMILNKKVDANDTGCKTEEFVSSTFRNDS